MATMPFNPETDYHEEINKAVSNGQYGKASILEKLRNAKIDAGYGESDEKTNIYENPLSFYGNSKKNAGAAGTAPAVQSKREYSIEQKEFLKQQREKKRQAFEEKYASVLAESEKSKNAAAGNTAQAAQGFNEQAAVTGLSSGAMSQKKDASGRVLQNYIDTQNKLTTDKLKALKKSYDEDVIALKKI